MIKYATDYNCLKSYYKRLQKSAWLPELPTLEPENFQGRFPFLKLNITVVASVRSLDCQHGDNWEDPSLSRQPRVDRKKARPLHIL